MTASVEQLVAATDLQSPRAGLSAGDAEAAIPSAADVPQTLDPMLALTGTVHRTRSSASMLSTRFAQSDGLLMAPPTASPAPVTATTCKRGGDGLPGARDGS